MIQVTLFVSRGDSRLTEIRNNLEQLQDEHPHQLHTIDIDQDETLKAAYEDKAPVLDIGIFRLVDSFGISDIRFAFEKAEERLTQAKSKGNLALVNRMTLPLEMTSADRISHWFSHHYMSLLNGFVFLYVFLAILAPSFMKISWEVPARVIYRVYSPLCHQLAFRSFFLFGEQTFYPLELVNVDGMVSYEQASGLDSSQINAARAFIGNEVMGYKTALCQRDLAIYSTILIFGVIFSVTGRKIKPIPWYLWVIIGLGPIGLDGFSQLLSQTGLAIFNWIPLRESTPLFRIITGSLFGLFTVWYGYPFLEESIVENRREMELKNAIVSQINEKKD